MTAIWTKEELHSLLAHWKAAYKAAATGKSYTIGGRSLTRQDLSEIRNQIDFLGRELRALESGTSTQYRRALVVR